MLVEDMTSAILNPTPTGASSTLTSGDNWNPGDARTAFAYGPKKGVISKKKKKKKGSSRQKKVKIEPFRRPPIQRMSANGADFSGP
jgi:hypothetical protein